MMVMERTRADVVGDGAARAELERRLGDALARLRHAARGPEPERGGDEHDAIVHQEVLEAALGDREAAVAGVKRLRAALDRMDVGDYGSCVDCEGLIAPKRLAAMPEVERCIGCQARLERQAQRRRAWVEEEAGE